LNEQLPSIFSALPSSPSPASPIPTPGQPASPRLPFSPDAAELQFDRAEASGSGAAAGPDTCAVCGTPLHGSYFLLNGKAACERCRYEVERQWLAGPGADAFVRALAGGLAGAVAGAVVYFLVLSTTGYEVGLIGILVGFLVGRGVRWGARGRGGWLYQGLALLLTYLAIVSTYVPLMLAGLHQATAPRLGPGAYLLLLALATTVPFRAVAGGDVITLIILGISLYQAWKLNRRQNLVLGGPYPLAKLPSPPAGAPAASAASGAAGAVAPAPLGGGPP
jgi:hypothetical protein